MTKTLDVDIAADHIRALLHAVEHSGETFVIERNGRAVAELTPPRLGVQRSRWADVQAMLRLTPHPDPDFAQDLAAIRQHLGGLPDDPWAPPSPLQQ